MVRQLQVWVGGQHKLVRLDDSVLVGRSPRCDFVVNDVYVSGMHLLIVGTLSNWVLVDQNSTNGVYHQGIRLRPGTLYRLETSGALRLGDPKVGTVLRYQVKEYDREEVEPKTGSVAAQEATMSFEIRAEDADQLPDSGEVSQEITYTGQDFAQLNDGELASLLLSQMPKAATDQELDAVRPRPGWQQ